MYDRIAVKRLSQDKLTNQVWVFVLIGNTLVLDGYHKDKRETVRHKLKPVAMWTRLDRRGNNLELSDVPYPSDVAAEARQKYIDGITVSKEYK